MKEESLSVLFSKLKEITSVKDIAYHAIGNGRLNPVYKTHTDKLGIEKWKSVHAQNPVYIKETEILCKIINTRSAVAVQDTKSDSLSSDAFFLFGIDSILVIPVLNDDNVIGIICVASIGEKHFFMQEEIDQCVQWVKHFTNDPNVSTVKA